MATIDQILRAKGEAVYHVRADDTVEDAIRLMASKDVGSVLVMDGDRLVGIMTERHYAREVFLKGRTSPLTRVGDVMSKDVIAVEQNRTAEECLALMAEKRIRHLPVLNEGRVVGLVSIGDLLRSVITGREFDLNQLVHYVRG